MVSDSMHPSAAAAVTDPAAPYAFEMTSDVRMAVVRLAVSTLRLVVKSEVWYIHVITALSSSPLPYG